MHKRECERPPPRPRRRAPIAPVSSPEMAGGKEAGLVPASRLPRPAKMFPQSCSGQTLILPIPEDLRSLELG